MFFCIGFVEIIIMLFKDWYFLEEICKVFVLEIRGIFFLYFVLFGIVILFFWILVLMFCLWNEFVLLKSLFLVEVRGVGCWGVMKKGKCCFVIFFSFCVLRILFFLLWFFNLVVIVIGLLLNCGWILFLWMWINLILIFSDCFILLGIVVVKFFCWV